MGLLDDAIRQHLELKRRRGADPAEVERAEREALGPVRRKGDPADAAFEPEDDDRDLDPALADADFDASDAERPTARFDDEPEQAGDGGSAGLGEAPSDPRGWTSHDVGHEDLYGPAAPPPAGGDSLEDGETMEYQLEDPEHENPEDDEMLEETPEFLQDTPDHDRLWFEQRPPRDFDFDG